jgi:hypothetical protein
MRGRILLPLIIILFINQWLPALSQGIYSGLAPDKRLIDTLKARSVTQDANRKVPDITLSRDQALIFLQKNCRPFLWKNMQNPLRSALEQLIFEASNSPADSVIYFLRSYPYDSLSIPWDKFYIWEPMRFKVVTDISDTIRREAAKDTIRTDSAMEKPLIQENANIGA